MRQENGHMFTERMRGQPKTATEKILQKTAQLGTQERENK